MNQINNNELRKTLSLKIEENYKKEILPISIDMFNALDKQSTQIGYKDYQDLYCKVLPYNKDQLVKEMELLLRSTLNIYKYLFNYVSNRILNKSLKVVEGYDLSTIWNLEEYSNQFSFSESVNKFSESITCINVVEKIKLLNLKIENGGTRSHCLPINIPKEIHLVIGKRNRPDDYKIVYHELGHAIHLLSLSNESSFEEKYWNDIAINEAYAFLFERLLYDKAYIKKEFSIFDNDYFRIQLFYRLYQLRYYCTMGIWELKHYKSNSVVKNIEVWKSFFYDNMLLKGSELGAYVNRELFFKSIDYVRSWMLEAQIRARLKLEIGDKWFANKKGEEFLSRLWGSRGNFRAEDVSKKLQYEEFNSNELITELLTEYRRIM